jgi:integrase
MMVAKLTEPGRYADGHGLYLQIRGDGEKNIAKSWVLKFMLRGVAREMGLGSVLTFTLAEARENAREAHKLLAKGVDPIEHRKQQVQAAALDRARAVTFRACAEAYINNHRAGWRSAKHASQWASTAATYIYPLVGDLPVASVDTALVLKILNPIWTQKPETASRVRGRIEAVLDFATASGFRRGDNPARWNGLLSELLPKKTKVARVRPMPSLPYGELPGFMATLRQQGGTAALALEFLILCASRTGEVLGARWDEISFADRTWKVPGERMKSGREHEVPLSDRALEIIETMRGRDKTFVFPHARSSRPLSDRVFLTLLGRLGHDGIVPHGFRSSFRTWCADRTAFPRDLCEAALAHVIGDAVEAAYNRTTMLDKRRKLMDAWTRYCAVVPTTDSGNIRAIGAAAG